MLFLVFILLFNLIPKFDIDNVYYRLLASGTLSVSLNFVLFLILFILMEPFNRLSKEIFFSIKGMIVTKRKQIKK